MQYNVTRWGWFGPAEDVLDTDDGLTPEVEDVFSNGQCHALALALHELRPDFQLVGIEWEEHPDTGDPVPNHVAVLDPTTGDVLDVGGWNALDRWNHGGWTPEPVEREYVTGELLDLGYLTPNLDAARAYAPLVLDAYAA